MHTGQSRREFLTALTAAGAAGVLGAQRSLADEGPPETTAIRLAYYKNNCLAPLLVAEDLLRLEGFTEIKYVSVPKSFLTPELVARGECNFANTFAGTLVSYLDNGLPITALSGVHAGCYELFAHEPIQTISELRGKKIAIKDLKSDGYYSWRSWRCMSGSTPKPILSGSRPMTL